PKITVLVAPAPLLMGSVWRRRHSICAWLSATRGGATSSLASGVSPESTNSSTVGATLAEQAFICSANSSETIFTTNSFVARTFARVSLAGKGPGRCAVTKQTTGGSAEQAIKKLNGA